MQHPDCAAGLSAGTHKSRHVYAILLWLGLGLGIWPTLWMFFWWMLLISLYFSSKIYLLVGTIGYYMRHRFGVKQTRMLAHLLTFSIVMVMLLVDNMAQISLCQHSCYNQHH